MVKFSKHNKRTLHRRGKQLLKSKVGLLKKRKTTLLKIPKGTRKLFDRSIILPASLQPSSLSNSLKSLRKIHTTLSTSSSFVAPAVNKTTKAPSQSSSPFRNGFNSDSTTPNDDRSISSSSTTTRKSKKISIKRLLGIKKDKKSPMEEAADSVLSIVRAEAQTPKRSEDRKSSIIITKSLEPVSPLKVCQSVETTDTTTPNTPVRDSCDNSTVNPESSDISVVVIDDDNENKNRSVPVTYSAESMTSTASSNDGKNYIFHDEEEELEAKIVSDNEETKEEGSNLPNSRSSKQSSNFVEYSEESIQTKLEYELNRLDEKLKSQKAERRALAKAKLDTTVIEEKKEATSDYDNNEDSRESRKVDSTESLKVATSSPIVGPQNCVPTRGSRFLSLLCMIIPSVLSMHWFLSKILLPDISYSHDVAMEQSLEFFGSSGPPTVVLSETQSELGSTLEDRFVQLGATVVSVAEEDIDCNDLESVGSSIDLLLETLDHGADFLIHTGNLCVNNNNIVDSIASIQPTVQGHNALFGGNYLSAFLVTQKMIPSLERSKIGTLVQFTSQASTLADWSQLDLVDEEIESDTSSSRPGASIPDSSSVAGLLNLPLRFASIKLSEIFQHKVLSRAYPNIRTMEISKGWRRSGKKSAAAEFFYHLFQKDEEEATAPVADNEDIQENLYHWSQNAVWKWSAPPVVTFPPVAEIFLGKPPSQHVVARSKQEVPSASAGRYLPTNTATVVTSGALALLAMKAKSLTWGSDGSWWSSSE